MEYKVKKKGFVLIEVIIVISITLILTSSVVMINKSVKSISNIIKAKSILNDISNIISFSKHYCSSKRKAGHIEINEMLGEAVFVDIEPKRNEIKRIKLPKGFKFLSNIKLKVRVDGHIESETIRVFDINNKKTYKVTIATGVDTVNIYEENN